MSLSAEQKERIVEEERQRLAEEQYRDQVRRELRNPDPTSPVDAPTPRTAPPFAPPPSHNRQQLLAIAAVIAGLFVVGIIFASLRHSLASSHEDNGATTSSVKASGRNEKAEPHPETPIKLTTEQIAEAAKPSVVVIRSFNADNQPIAQGSGYIYSADGIVVTNYHVIRGANSIQIQTPSRGDLHADAILGYSPEHDVAALAVAEGNLPELKAGSKDEIHVGDRVVAIGAPLGLDDTVTEGIVSARRRAAGIELIQTSAAISHGSSGGPLINEFGNVIGLNALMRTGGENLNFAVPVRYVSELLARQRRMSFSEMLEETHVVNHFSSSSFTVQARSATWFAFAVTQPTGATLSGTFDIYGGGRDVNVYLTNNDGAMLASFGRSIGEGRISRRLAPGQYKLVFDNKFSMLTAKSVTPDLGVEYYK